eukprot:14181404-Alexandrium_andersonii.AAC.1
MGFPSPRRSRSPPALSTEPEGPPGSPRPLKARQSPSSASPSPTSGLTRPRPRSVPLVRRGG